LVVGSLLSATGAAQISPGPLARSHERLEGSRACLQCHRSNRGVDPQLCLKCHAALARRIAAGKGFHAQPSQTRCERCHADHNGVDFALIYWGQQGKAAFDHRATGYALQGKHAGLECAKCHTVERVPPDLRTPQAGVAATRTYLGLSTACVDCHADPHRGALSASACTSCHSETAWKPASGFDHARTRYPLTGKHSSTPCLKCHVQETGAGDTSVLLGQFKDSPRPACARCHEDVHRGKLGADCERCHGTSNFRDTGSFRAANGTFDHERTAYPLRGLHRPVACERCHTPGRSLRIAAFERCTTCHSDTHRRQLDSAASGAGCATCHSVDGFKPAAYGAVEHAKSRFALRESHLAVPCSGCHKAVASSLLARGFTSSHPTPVTKFRFDSMACRDCHRDPHEGQLDRYAGTSGCAACHGDGSWREVRFDHDRSNYPLQGRHKEVACERCHPRAAKPATLTRLTGLPKDCAGCHQDPHAGQFSRLGSTACERCHNIDEFKKTNFNHAKDSTYILDGAHVRVPCAGCHRTDWVEGRAVVRYKPVPHACTDCHKSVPTRHSRTRSRNP
jgi:hypothetical protein